jgi:hypothetical protein
MGDNGSALGGALGWCYWDYPVAPIGLYVVVGLLAHIPTTPPHPPPHPPRLVCGGNHSAGTLVPIWGGSPVAVPQPPALRALSLYLR